MLRGVHQPRQLLRRQVHRRRGHNAAGVSNPGPVGYIPAALGAPGELVGLIAGFQLGLELFRFLMSLIDEFVVVPVVGDSAALEVGRFPRDFLLQLA